VIEVHICLQVRLRVVRISSNALTPAVSQPVMSVMEIMIVETCLMNRTVVVLLPVSIYSVYSPVRLTHRADHGSTVQFSDVNVATSLYAANAYRPGSALAPFV